MSNLNGLASTMGKSNAVRRLGKLITKKHLKVLPLFAQLLYAYRYVCEFRTVGEIYDVAWEFGQGFVAV